MVLAAGLSTRYGRLKQLDPVGPGGEALLDYAVFDAVRAGFRRVVFVVRDSIETDFRAHVAPMMNAGLDVAFVHQALDDVPPGFRSAIGRTRPWGTGHAVWCARDAIDGPFAVCNADDFYGPSAYGVLARALDGGTDCALVGYRLLATLSKNGGVSRGLVQSDPQGWVTGVDEVVDLRGMCDARVVGVGPEDRPVDVADDVYVSMNLWGFPADVMDALGELFGEFLAAAPGEQQEFYLSTAIGSLVQRGRLRCRLLPTEESWLGVTFPQDRDRVASSLLEHIKYSTYPASLAQAWITLIEAS